MTDFDGNGKFTQKDFVVIGGSATRLLLFSPVLGRQTRLPLGVWLRLGDKPGIQSKYASRHPVASGRSPSHRRTWGLH